METRRCGTLPGLSSLPNSTTKCPKHLGSAVQSKSTLTCRVGMIRRQPLEARLDTHWTIISSHPVYKWYRLAAPMPNRSHEQQGPVLLEVTSENRGKWLDLGLESPRLVLDSCPATHMAMPISPALKPKNTSSSLSKLT